MATFSFKKNKTLYLSGTNLSKRSFRLNQRDYKNPLIVIIAYVRCIKEIFSVKKTEDVLNSGDFIYDLNPESKEIRKTYIKYFTGKVIDNYISKEFLIGHLNVLSKFVIFSTYSITVIPFFIFTLFSKNRASLSLIFREVIENSVVLNLVAKHKLSNCYFFSIYEKDSNLAAYLLMNAGVKVVKIPSEVPFYFFNTTIICDKLIICNAYQFEEKEFYRDTVLCKETEMWGPERVTDYYEIYKANNFKIQRGVIAFYSTASWVREKEGHLDQGTEMVKNEKLLLNYLKKYLSQRKDLKLIIYAHPKEKSEKYLNETKQFYSLALNGVDFDYADFATLSAASFYNAELAVAFNSTLIHERLYFGFKTLILPLNHPGFPIKNSSFNNICAYSEEELFLKMDKDLKQTEEEFFTTNGLTNYRFKN